MISVRLILIRLLALTQVLLHVSPVQRANIVFQEQRSLLIAQLVITVT